LRGVQLLARYGLAGLANTALGFGLILFCDAVLHLRPSIANAAGYVAGWVLSYALNRRFVFRSQSAHRVTGVRYVVAVLVAFALNQLILQAALRLLPSGTMSHAVAQAAGVIAYTSVLFVLCAAWVFPKTRPSS
jgi:putative flippase GtrA